MATHAREGRDARGQRRAFPNCALDYSSTCYAGYPFEVIEPFKNDDQERFDRGDFVRFVLFCFVFFGDEFLLGLK